MKYIAVTGATGSGKSRLAKAIATELGGEIVGCDSVQVYRDFDIGSAKESTAARLEIPHHLIDIIDWHCTYDAAQYARDARKAIAEINGRGKIAVVAGGTGLYLRALSGDKFHDLPTDPEIRAELDKLSSEALYLELAIIDPERAAILHKNDRVRLLRAVELVKLMGKPISETVRSIAPEFPPSLTIYINPPRADLHKTIEARSRKMVEHGLIGEVQALIDRGCPTTIKPMQSIGYAQVVGLIEGSIKRSELVDKIVFATRQYAKRQCTWFGKLPSEVRLESLTDLDRIMKEIKEQI
jgi:tRNA dimethylallyltransferase